MIYLEEWQELFQWVLREVKLVKIFFFCRKKTFIYKLVLIY